MFRGVPGVETGLSMDFSWIFLRSANAEDRWCPGQGLELRLDQGYFEDGRFVYRKRTSHVSTRRCVVYRTG